ncbi:MAG: autotransporter assembly complex protein TamA [Gammaproteobacteria bacterium]|nr:autotransporter assembly complex protein TamA [Gammaproteobacteria bacterium]
MPFPTEMTRSCVSFSFLTLLLVALEAKSDLQIEGVDDELTRNVRQYVALAGEPCDAEEWLVKRRFRSADAEVRAALEPFGYYNPTIEKTLAIDDDCWQATISIDPGEPVTLRNVDVTITTPSTGSADFSDLKAPESLVAGTRLRHAHYESFKENLQVRAAERGYVDAEFTENTIDVWPAERAADITLQYDSGPRYNFGEIRMDEDFLEASLVRAFLEFDEGMPYDSRLVNQGYADLSLSGYFSRIELLPVFEEAADGKIPLQIALEPADRIEYTAGAGFSTDSGPRFRAGYQNRRLNRKGHRFKADLSLSSIIQGLTAEHRRPMADPRSEWTSYTAAVSREDNDAFKDETARIGFRRAKRVGQEWIRTLSVDLSNERFELSSETRRTRLMLPAVAFDHKRADRDISPTHGRRLTIELRGTGRFLGSSTSFLQTLISARFVRSLSADSRILARATVGATAKSEFDDLPPSVRFFAGGDESVRGFDYNELGPKDDEGNVIGGSNLLVASIEYEHRLRGNFFGAVFMDAGNAFDTLDVDAAVGAGIGVKWISPVGPLRFYLAHPLNKSDRSVRLHIQLGADL